MQLQVMQSSLWIYEALLNLCHAYYKVTKKYFNVSIKAINKANLFVCTQEEVLRNLPTSA